MATREPCAEEPGRTQVVEEPRDVRRRQREQLRIECVEPPAVGREGGERPRQPRPPLDVDPVDGPGVAERPDLTCQRVAGGPRPSDLEDAVARGARETRQARLAD